MTTLSIQPPFPPFADRAGAPLQNGYIWIGTAALNPITNPIAVYWDAALTQAAAQPIRTQGGYPVNNGTPARLYVGSDYSILVQDSKGTLVYQAPNATERWSDVVVTGVDSSEVTFLQAGTGAQTRTVQSKLRDTVSLLDFGGQASFSYDNTLAFQNALAAHDHVIVPPGDWGVGAMIEILSQKCVELMAGATVKRMAALSASEDPVFWLKGTAAVLKGAGKIASGIATENRCPKGVVRIGHKDMTESHDNVTYCTLADLGIYGAVDYGRTTGNPDVCVYMPNPELGSPVKASYFHTVRSLRISSANVGIWLHGHANANCIFDITGQELGNVTLGGSMLSLNGGSDNRISGFFFHLSPGTTFIDIEDEGAIVSSMNTLNGMVCEQGGSGLFIKANAGCTAVSNYIQGQDNTVGGSDLSSAFKASNIIFTRELFYMQTAYITDLYLNNLKVGDWIPVAYNAGDFSGNGSMTWTVDAGDLNQFAYTLVGKTMTVAFSISTSSVGGTPNTNLLIKIPASKTAKLGNIRAAVSASDNGTAAVASVITVASDTQLAIQKPTVANWTASTNNTAVHGQITFEIN